MMPSLSTNHLITSYIRGLSWEEPKEDTLLTSYRDSLSWVDYYIPLKHITLESTTARGLAITTDQNNIAILGRTVGDEPSFVSVTSPNGEVGRGPSYIGPGSVNMQTISSTVSSGPLPGIPIGRFAVIGGGRYNVAQGEYSTIRGGYFNNAVDNNSTIGGGDFNRVNGAYSTVLGGGSNVTSGAYSTILGGRSNKANVDHSTVSGYYGTSNAYASDRSLFILSRVDEAPFEVKESGTVHASMYYDTGADYAEMYESKSNVKIPVGTTVVFEDGYVRPSRDDEVPIAVISDTAGIVLNSDSEHWHGKYITVDSIEDELEYVTTPVEITEDVYVEREGAWHIETKTTIEHEQVHDEVDVYIGDDIVGKKNVPRTKKIGEKIVTRQMINPLYDDSQKYVPRADRPEWNVVGLLGKCKVLHNQPINPSWLLLERGEQYDIYIVRC